ncbi:MAG: hypothetical protein LQ344_006606 [Seirophora lacunosa]|nr:MAG: hypothetical protein LQ344_006606 [Seirophora lacunosa]
MVDKLIHYLYNSDYDDTGLLQDDKGKDNDDIGLKVTREGEEGKTTTQGMDEETGQNGKVNEEEESGWRIDEEDKNEGAKEEPEFQESQLLALNVGMYIIGDRFELSQLKDLAKEKFSAALIERWDKENLADVIRTIYDNTIPSDRPLRDSLVPTLQINKKALREDEDFMNLVRSHGDFAVDLLDALSNTGDLEGIQLSRRLVGVGKSVEDAAELELEPYRLTPEYVRRAGSEAGDKSTGLNFQNSLVVVAPKIMHKGIIR